MTWTQTPPTWTAYLARRWWSIYSRFPHRILAAYAQMAEETRNDPNPFVYELHRVDIADGTPAWVICSPDQWQPFPETDNTEEHDG